MTWQWTYTGTPDDSVNLSPATGAVAMYIFKEFLKQLGWTVQSSADGSSYSADSDIITSGNSGANGFGNNSAWFCARDPSGLREMVVQRGTGNTTWRMKWSHVARFTGGSPSATVPPTATDQQMVAGTDVPAYITLWAADAGYKLHMGGDTADGSFWLVAANTGAASTAKQLIYTPLLSGSYPAEDTAPYVVQMANATWTAANMGSLTVNTGGAQGYYKYGLSGEAWVNYRVYPIGFSTAGTALLANGVPVNAYTGGDNIFPAMAMRLAADGTAGIKGFIPTSHSYMDAQSRASGDVVDVGSSRYAVFNGYVVRWPAGVTPVI